MIATIFANSAQDPSGQWTNPQYAVGPVTTYSASIPVGNQQQTPPIIFGFDAASLGIHPLSTIDSIEVTCHARADCPLDPNVGVAVYSEGVPVQAPIHSGVLATIEPWAIEYAGPFGIKLDHDALTNLTIGVNGYAYGPGYLYLHAVALTVHWTPPSTSDGGPL